MAPIARASQSASGWSRRDPTNSGAERDLAAIHFNLGELLAPTDVAGALAEHRAALAITQVLVRAEPNRTGWQRELAESHHTIGRLLRTQGHSREARAELEAALGVLQQLGAAVPDTELRGEIAKLHAELRRLPPAS